MPHSVSMTIKLNVAVIFLIFRLNEIVPEEFLTLWIVAERPLLLEALLQGLRVGQDGVHHEVHLAVQFELAPVDFVFGAGRIFFEGTVENGAPNLFDPRITG